MLETNGLVNCLPVEIGTRNAISIGLQFLAHRRSVLTQAIKESGIKTASETLPFN
jgi:hypothetical protein